MEPQDEQGSLSSEQVLLSETTGGDQVNLSNTHPTFQTYSCFFAAKIILFHYNRDVFQFIYRRSTVDVEGHIEKAYFKLTADEKVLNFTDDAVKQKKKKVQIKVTECMAKT